MSQKPEEITDEELDELASSLTRLQRMSVCYHVEENLTQRQAYLKAGGKAKKPDVQDCAAYEIFRNPQVKKYKNALLKRAQIAAIASREEILLRLSHQALIKITDLCNFKNHLIGHDESGEPIYQTTWTMKDSDDIKPEHAAAIKSVSTTKDGLKIEMHDPVQSQKLLADMMDWNSKTKIDLSSADGSMTPKHTLDASKLSSDTLREILEAQKTK